MIAGPGVCGSPAEVADRIARMREEVGLDVHLAMMDLGGMPECDLYDSIDLYGAKVAPAVRA